MLLATPQTGEAAVKSLKDLSFSQSLALQESERRTVIYDHALRNLEIARARQRINRQEFLDEERDLVGYIGAEARFQNTLLTRDSTFPDEAREVLQNFAKYSVEVPLYLAGMVLRGAPNFSFSP